MSRNSASDPDDARRAHVVVDPDPKRMQAFLDLLRQRKEPRIPGSTLWVLFGQTFPYRPGSTESRHWFLAVLREAEKQGIICLPPVGGKRWDHGLSPPVPTSVQKVATPPSKTEERWRTFPWHPQLSWIADLDTLSTDQELFLKRIQEALIQGMFQKRAPFTYRSLQLTGNEKRLGELVRTALFKPGRLSLDFLGCAPDIPPLALERVGEGPVALVFENASAWRCAYDVLTHLPRSPYGFLGYGAGAVFEKSILHLKLSRHQIERIEYIGDLDRPGLRIASACARLARAEGLPPLVPAQGLHQAMVQAAQNFGYPEGMEYRTEEKRRDPQDETLVTWLPETIRAKVLLILRAGRRIPEEVLGPEEMRMIWDDPSFTVG